MHGLLNKTEIVCQLLSAAGMLLHLVIQKGNLKTFFRVTANGSPLSMLFQ